MPTLLRPIYIDEIDAIATCLTAAFKTDTFFHYLVDCDGNTPAQQDEVAYSMFKYLHSALLLSGGKMFTIVDTAEPTKCLAVASWMPPGVKFDTSLLMLIRSGMWRFRYLLGPQTRSRFLDEYVAAAGVQQDILTEGRDVWYLFFLGAIPEERGKGHSRTLIQFISAQADATKHPLYLESSSQSNAENVYSKHGFVEKGALYFGTGDAQLRMPLMLREPK